MIERKKRIHKWLLAPPVLPRITFMALLFVCIAGFNTREQHVPLMKACENYIENYSPQYIVNGDTLDIARFNDVPERINNYLISCARKGDFAPLKYAAALMIRHNKEYSRKNKSDYIIGDGLLHQKNGFIVLLRQAMKVGKVDDDLDSMNYFIYNTGEVCLWINDHKHLISDYDYVKRYINSLSE